MSKLFSPLKIRGVEFRNRAWVSPMCMYSSRDGMPTDWHLVHLGSRAVGGAGLVMMEATAVAKEGRISPEDAGIWSEAQAEAYLWITRFIHEQGSIAGIQLAHAGRKANNGAPALAPSAIPFSKDYSVPVEMSAKDMKMVVAQFVNSAQLALRAGFQVLELHMAHGYLLHEFLSPLSNRRKDQYGGSFDNRIRFPLEVVQAVRTVWSQNLPLFVRISGSDWVDHGWDLAQSIQFAAELSRLDVDLIDCSSGGLVPDAKIPVGAFYQVPFAENIRREAAVMTAAVGLITEPEQAEAVLNESRADAIFIGRAFLRDPYWALHAAIELGAAAPVPRQYDRAF